MSAVLQGECDGASADYGDPILIHLRNPTATAINAVAIIGRPAGKIGVITIANTAQPIASARSLFALSRELVLSELVHRPPLRPVHHLVRCELHLASRLNLLLFGLLTF